MITLCFLMANATAEEDNLATTVTNEIADAAADLTVPTTSLEIAETSSSPESVDQSPEDPKSEIQQNLSVEKLVSPQRLSSSLQIVLVMSVLSLAPAILLMTTSFIRISIVLSLLRQAFGAQQMPSNQVTTSISLFMTMLIMWPVWSKVYETAIVPYSNETIEWQTAWQAGVNPVREFMIGQIVAAENQDDVLLFASHLPEGSQQPENFSDVPLQALMPAYILSELKTAFFIGFQVYLPFLVIDIVVAAVTMSMGMIMLPPTMISLPMKLLLFVLVDGWHLVVQMLLDSFVPLSYR